MSDGKKSDKRRTVSGMCFRSISNVPSRSERLLTATSALSSAYVRRSLR